MAGRPPNPIDQSTFLGRMGAGLRRRRERKRLSVEEAATAVGVDHSTWSRWEAGRHPMPLEKLAAVAEALGCTVRKLLPDE